MAQKTSQWVSGLARGCGIAAMIWRHPGNRHRRLRRLLGFLSWQFVKHVLKSPMVVSFHNQRLKCFPDSTSTSGVVYFGDYPDYREMKFLEAYLRKGDHVLDIGANAGVYTVLASGFVGPTGSVDAFEPADASAKKIEEQVELNGLRNVRVHRVAVSDEAGERLFGYSTNDAMAHLQGPGEASANAARVTTVKLDSFEPYLSYAVGKMDIEGAEPLALSGARNRLVQANPPVWLLELAGYSTAYGFTTEQVMQQLSDAGFDCAVFDPATGKLEYTRSPWLLGVQNVLAISKSHQLAVDRRLAHSSGLHQ
jgi:FkbM family methyltransferase